MGKAARRGIEMIADDNMAVQQSILVERVGSLGRIRVNRPKALNSLTLDMVRLMSQALDQFAGDPQIAMVLVTGEGERGLCAGGDIRLLYDSSRSDPHQGETFWREEYILNARIGKYPKPYIAIMDGITMGGGVGISAHGSHRIVTERTRLAMPETGIGFFPDVGGTWILSHGPGEIGTYLGLTGAQIGGADAIYAGLADRLVPTTALPALIDSLSGLPVGSTNDMVMAVVTSHAGPVEVAPLQENRAEIDRIFFTDDVETIIASLRQSTSPFAAKTCETLLAKSPTSLKVTLKLLRLARASKSLEDCLNREFSVARNLFIDHDFHEGVRAAVIDKDRNPRWSPASLDEVDDDKINAYFAAAPEPVFRT
jgi:enoyl-CoA hydratase